MTDSLHLHKTDLMITAAGKARGKQVDADEGIKLRKHCSSHKYDKPWRKIRERMKRREGRKGTKEKKEETNSRG